MAEPPVLTIHTDGASRGNPGAAAYAYVLDRGDHAPPIEEAGCLGQMTNNQAEYTALVRALEHALELGAEQRLEIHSDSELLVKQMKGEYRVKNEELRGLYEEARGLVKHFRGGVTIRHVRRAQNARADALCNEALDGLRQPTPRPGLITPAPGPAPTLSARALACLREAEVAWRQGADQPTPEDVWRQLVEVLEGHGVRVPKT